ncbi:MAG: hypothetical protein KDA99_04680, partial [Planctomycetales bacterium]|nr:hypothetical protein [Planctomycetales bacterium]
MMVRDSWQSIAAFALVAFLWQIGVPHATGVEWSDDFEGGLHLPWDFAGDDFTMNPIQFVSDSVVDGQLQLAGDPAFAALGSFNQFAVAVPGLTQPSQSLFFADEVHLRATVSSIQNINFNGTAVQGNNDVFVVARTDGASGYVLALDMNSGEVDLVRSDFGFVSGLGDGSSTEIVLDPNASYVLELSAIGNQLSGKVYDSSMNELVSVMATDDTYVSGFAGVGAAINDDDSIGGDGGPGRTLIAAAFDKAAAQDQPFVDVVPLLGDYNQNGAVDAADYTVWKD